MIRKFLYITVILFAMSNIAFGAEASSSSTSSAATTSNQFVSGLISQIHLALTAENLKTRTTTKPKS